MEGSIPSSSSLSTFPFLPVISHKKRVGFLRLSTNVALLGFPWNEHPCLNVSEKLNTCYSILILWHARESWEGKELVLVMIHLGYWPFSAWSGNDILILRLKVYIYILCVIYELSLVLKRLFCIAASSPQFFDKFTKTMFGNGQLHKILANVGPSSSHFPCPRRRFEDVLATLLRISQLGDEWVNDFQELKALLKVQRVTKFPILGESSTANVW